MIEWIVEPFQYAFMVRGLVAAVLVGIICAIIGSFVVLRGMAFFGNALSHSILPGVAVGYLVNGSDRRYIFWWALAAAFVSAFGIGMISQNSRIKEDTAIGIIFAGMFALGIALISTVRDYTTDLTHFLFGDVLSVSQEDLLVTAIFGLLVLLVILLFYKEFKLIAFDPVFAKTLRLPTGFLNYLLFILIAVTIVVSLQTVGIALMVAMLITPAATAHLVTRRLSRMMLVSAIIAACSGLSGLYISFYVNISSGAAIVLVATAIFLFTLLIQFISKRFMRS